MTALYTQGGQGVCSPVWQRCTAVCWWVGERCRNLTDRSSATLPSSLLSSATSKFKVPGPQTNTVPGSVGNYNLDPQCQCLYRSSQEKWSFSTEGMSAAEISECSRVHYSSIDGEKPHQWVLGINGECVDKHKSHTGDGIQIVKWRFLVLLLVSALYFTKIGSSVYRLGEQSIYFTLYQMDLVTYLPLS